MKIACIMLVISAACLTVSFLIGMRSLTNDRIGDFLDRHDTWITVLFYLSGAGFIICLGVTPALVLFR